MSDEVANGGGPYREALCVVDGEVEEDSRGPLLRELHSLMSAHQSKKSRRLRFRYRMFTRPRTVRAIRKAAKKGESSVTLTHSTSVVMRLINDLSEEGVTYETNLPEDLNKVKVLGVKWKWAEEKKADDTDNANKVWDELDYRVNDVKRNLQALEVDEDDIKDLLEVLHRAVNILPRKVSVSLLSSLWETLKSASCNYGDMSINLRRSVCSQCKTPKRKPRPYP